MQVQFHSNVPTFRSLTQPNPEKPAQPPLDGQGPPTPPRDDSRAKILAATGLVAGCAGGAVLGHALSPHAWVAGTLSSVGMGAIGVVGGAVAGLALASKFSSGGHTAGLGAGFAGVALGAIGGGIAGVAAGAALGTLAPAVTLGVLGAGAGLIAAARLNNQNQ